MQIHRIQNYIQNEGNQSGIPVKTCLIWDFQASQCLQLADQLQTSMMYLSLIEIIDKTWNRKNQRARFYQPNFSISSNIWAFSRGDKSPNSVPISLDFSNLRIIFPVRVFGKSDNWKINLGLAIFPILSEI